MEQFATFDRLGKNLGLCDRDEVHRLGLWHQSAHVFVFDAQGRLLIQRRAADKDLYAGLWDYSVGEHLKPDESFAEGALRGLREELGISTPQPLTPLGGQRWMEIVTEHHADREIQQAYRCNYVGELVPCPVEVAEVRYISPLELAGWVAARPEDFTPWFINDLVEFRIIELSA